MDLKGGLNNIIETKISKIIPEIIKEKLNLIYFKLRSYLTGINYSKEWYETEYHLNIYQLDKRSYDEIMSIWEKKGYKNRLYEVLNYIKVPQNAKWLEVACHHGKTAFWCAERYKDITFYMFDFSSTAIEWIKNNNPISDRTILWAGDIQNIAFKDNNFDDFFDVITCIDVTEHLPSKIYKNGIKEMYRVLKPNGILIVVQGNSNIPEHINIRTEKQYILNFLKKGFKLVKKLPNRHYYLTK